MRILCYWDSNTRWYKSWTRYERLWSDKRRPKVLQSSLWDSFEIIEEWLNSRTLISDDKRPGKEWRNGSTYLIPCLDSHDPLDHVVLMLWTNELKDSYAQDISSILWLLENQYIKIVTSRKSQFRDTIPSLILVAPPPIDISKDYAKQRYWNVWWKVEQVSNWIKELANKYWCKFIDTSDLETWPDWVHLNDESHVLLAERIAKSIE